LNRWQFALLSLLVNALVVVTGIAFVHASRALGVSSRASAPPIIGIGVLVAAIAAHVILVSRRLRDIGMSPLHAWKLLIGVYNWGFIAWLWVTPTNYRGRWRMPVLVYMLTPILAVANIYFLALGEGAALRHGHRRHAAREVRDQLARLADNTQDVRRRTGTFCLSAAHSIPASVPHGTPIRVSDADWDGDARTAWQCLDWKRFGEVEYQYSYVGTKDTFTITALGDVNGNGIESVFVIRGTADGDKVTVSPIEATNPDE
jgi:uncharacterized membrane protein YhaH (DUF805 family)